MRTPEKRSTPNAQRPTPNAEGSQKTLRLCVSALTTLELPDSRTSRLGFTLFELIAVLTVIGIGLAVLVGSYGSWGTAHALTGATRVVEAGLTQARTLAMTRRTYIAFSYGSTNAVDAPLSVTTGFQAFLCTNRTDAAVSETDLKDLVETITRDTQTLLPSEETTLFKNVLVLDPAAPFHRLTRHVRLYRPDSGEHTPSLLIFRPDGSILTDDGITPLTDPYHYIAIQTAESFSLGKSASAPLVRLLRIDPATGLATLIGGEP